MKHFTTYLYVTLPFERCVEHPKLNRSAKKITTKGIIFLTDINMFSTFQ